MAVIGVLTGIGLSLIGVPLAIVLALLAALLAALLSCIPNIGPILAAVPAVLPYLGVQIVETYVLAPFIDRKTIYLPPALTVLAQLTMAVFAGLLGIALATPILAMRWCWRKRSISRTSSETGRVLPVPDARRFS